MSAKRGKRLRNCLSCGRDTVRPVCRQCLGQPEPKQRRASKQPTSFTDLDLPPEEPTDPITQHEQQYDGEEPN